VTDLKVSTRWLPLTFFFVLSVKLNAVSVSMYRRVVRQNPKPKPKSRPFFVNIPCMYRDCEGGRSSCNKGVELAYEDT
jgi:hypothetical protein